VLIKSNYKTRLHNSRSKTPLSLNEFLNPENKTIVNKDINIFISVINYYISVSLDKEKESSNKEKVKKVDTAKALKAVKTVKM
jgi:hypothetical protein